MKIIRIKKCDIDFRKSFAFYPCVYLDKSVDDYKKAGDNYVISFRGNDYTRVYRYVGNR